MKQSDIDCWLYTCGLLEKLNCPQNQLESQDVPPQDHPGGADGRLPWSPAKIEKFSEFELPYITGLDTAVTWLGTVLHWQDCVIGKHESDDSITMQGTVPQYHDADEFGDESTNRRTYFCKHCRCLFVEGG